MNMNDCSSQNAVPNERRTTTAKDEIDVAEVQKKSIVADVRNAVAAVVAAAVEC